MPRERLPRVVPPPQTERPPRPDSFQLASPAERRQYPFVAMDPSFTEDPVDIDALPIRHIFREQIKRDGNYDRSPPVFSAFNYQTFAALCHFVLKGELRRRVADIVQHNGEWDDLALLQPLLGLKIVDYGSGDIALFSHYLRELGAEVKNINSYPTDNPDVIWLHDLAHHPDLAGADIVTCTSVFEPTNPLQSDKGSEAGRIIEHLLKSGGLLILSPIPAETDDHPANGMQHLDTAFGIFSGAGGIDDWSVARKAEQG